ncbi:potassium channel [Aureococcus anophagefferens]
MTTPVLEERGLVVPDGLFEIPDASPSGADFQIPSQFDNPRGQFHGTSTFGRSAREDAFSYLRSIGGGGAGGWEVACGGAARWCASGPGPERYELGGEGDGSFGTAPPVCAEFRAPMRKTTKGRTAEETVRELTERTWGGATMGAVVACSVRSQEQYAMPRALDACYGSQFARAERFEKDPIDVRAVPGAYEDEIHFAKTTATTKAAGNAHKSYTIGESERRVAFMEGKEGPTSYIDINGEGSFYYDVILAEKKRLQTRRPYMLCGVPRECCPQEIPKRKPLPVYEHAGLHKVLADPASAKAVRRHGPDPVDADGDDRHNLARAWWPNAKPGASWPPPKRRQPGKKTVVRQRMFGSADRLELIDGMRHAGKLRCADGPGPCAYDPCDPNAPPITDEARASLNLTCGYKAPPKTPGGRARKKAAPIVVSSEGILAPKNLMGFPRPPNWLDYPSPAGDKILTMVSPARRDVRSSKSRRDLKSSTSQRRVHAADYALRSSFSSPPPEPTPAAA